VYQAWRQNRRSPHRSRGPRCAEPRNPHPWEAGMEPDIPKRTNAFIELFPSIGLSSWIGNSAAASTRCWRGFLVGIKHRRGPSRPPGLGGHTLPGIGLTRSGLYLAPFEPFLRGPAPRPPPRASAPPP